LNSQIEVMKKKRLQNIKLKENGYQIPEGYFDSVEDDVFAKITSEKFPKQNGFSSPKDYLDEVEMDLVKILKKDNYRETGFDIPNNFFEEIEDKVIRKLSDEKKIIKVVPFKSFILNRITPILAAASILLVLYLTFNNNSSNFDSIAATDIEKWINEDLITFDINEIAEVYNDTEIDAQDIFAEDDLENYLYGTDIESLLYEN